MLESTRNMSYLHARDPSILSWGGAQLHTIKCNLKDFMNTGIEETILNESEEDPKHVKVYLRFKNCDALGLYEINGNELLCKVPENVASAKHIREGTQVVKKFKFSKIFPPDCQQKEVFDYLIKPRVLNFINGSNTTLLTYGASGAGKTFTIVGTPSEPGIVPRVLEYLFKTLPILSAQPKVKPKANGEYKWLTDAEGEAEMQILNQLLNIPTIAADKIKHANTYKAMQKRLSKEEAALLDENEAISMGVWVSFAEIYNEQVYDLLKWELPNVKSRPKLKICNNNGATYIKNLKHVCVSSGMEAFQILHCGLLNLNYAATAINSHSSRSHCIFTIKLLHAYAKDDVKMSHFNFCDLAGSERSKKTNNVGDRLKESNNINTSLLVLGKCISTLRNGQKSNDKKLVPFRESKLTQLLQKALTGFEDIAMIVNVNPVRAMFEESLHALNFSAIAKEIEIEGCVPEKAKRKQEDLRIEDLEADNEILRETVINLYNMLDSKDEEFERLESEIRRKLTEDCKNHVDALNKKYRTQINELMDENKELKDRIKEIEQKAKRPRYDDEDDDNDDSVICLDDSSSQVSSDEDQEEADLPE